MKTVLLGIIAGLLAVIALTLVLLLVAPKAGFTIKLYEKNDSGGYPTDCFVAVNANGSAGGMSCIYGRGPKE